MTSPLPALTRLLISASASESDWRAISDDGLAALPAGVPALAVLHLDLAAQGDETEVSDAGVASILALPALRRLTLILGAAPEVTPEGDELLRVATPLLHYKRGDNAAFGNVVSEAHQFRAWA